MTTRELIARLQESDPSGELPIIIDGGSPYLITTEPAHYDGYGHVLIEDAAKKPYWSIIGGRIHEHGTKLTIRTLRIPDVLTDMPEMPIEASPRWADVIEEWRREAREP